MMMFCLYFIIFSHFKQ